MSDEEHENYLKISSLWLENEAAIERVRGLHTPVASLNGHGPLACAACSKLVSQATGLQNWVMFGFCPTIRALEGKQP